MIQKRFVILTLFILLLTPIAAASTDEPFNLFDFLFNNTAEPEDKIIITRDNLTEDNSAPVDYLKIYGFVIDIDGQHLVNNTVYLNSTNKSFQINSSDTGYYEFTELEPGGLYNISTSNILRTLVIPLNLTESLRCDLSLIATMSDNPLIEFRYIKQEKSKDNEPIILGMADNTTAIIDLTGQKEKLKPYFWPAVLIIGIFITVTQAKKDDGSLLSMLFGFFLIFLWMIYNSKIAIVCGV